MSFCLPALFYPAMLMKDSASRFIVWAHALKHRRNPYPVMRHQNIRLYSTLKPITEDAAFIAPNASVVGNVKMGTDSCFMYHACIRNYHSRDSSIIGDHTAVLENVSFMGTCKVGSNCVLGVGSTYDSCTIHDSVIVGHHCNVALGAVIEQGAIIANGSTVYQDTRVPANELWSGNPAVKVCDVTAEQRQTARGMHHRHEHAGKDHRIAIEQHYAEVPKEYNFAWLSEMCEKIDQQHKSVAFEEEIKVPLEGRQFMAPRVMVRLPQMQARVSYQVNRIAPHKPRMPDQTGNC